MHTLLWFYSQGALLNYTCYYIVTMETCTQKSIAKSCFFFPGRKRELQVGSHFICSIMYDISSLWKRRHLLTHSLRLNFFYKITTFTTKTNPGIL